MIRCGSVYCAVCICVVIFAGCASTQPTRFYVLSSAAEPGAQQVLAAESAIGIGPVEIPQYLDRPQIISRIGGNELHLADFHHWAEPLKKSIARVLKENLSKRLGTDRAYVYPWPRAVAVAWQVKIDIIRFDGVRGGEVVLQARWSLAGRDAGKAGMWQSFSLRESVSGPGYEALAAAQSRALDGLSREIAALIAERQRPRK